MGDFREFLIAVLIYICAAFSIYATMGMINMHPLLRVFLVLGGGFVVGTGFILAWGGVVKLCNRRKR